MQETRVIPLVITVKEARKLLGRQAADLTDEQVEGYIRAFMDIAVYGLQNISSNNILGTHNE
jgi:hypothetical protein